MALNPTLLLGIILAYFAVLLQVAYLTRRNRDSADFFVAGRQSPWPLVPYANAARLQPLVSAARFTTVPGGGHSGLVDYPAVQRVLDRVLGTF